MKWLRLAFSVILFPLSLLWYRRDIDHFRIPVVAYWLAVAVWVAANVVGTIYFAQNLAFALPGLE